MKKRGFIILNKSYITLNSYLIIKLNNGHNFTRNNEHVWFQENPCAYRELRQQIGVNVWVGIIHN